MAEYTVENDADTTLARRRDKAAEVLYVAEHGVDAVIVTGIVVMVALRLKDGIEVDA